VPTPRQLLGLGWVQPPEAKKKVHLEHWLEHWLSHWLSRLLLPPPAPLPLGIDRWPPLPQTPHEPQGSARLLLLQRRDALGSSCGGLEQCQGG